MPIYEFQCQKCNNQFEVLVSSTAAATDTIACSRCGSREIRKTISAASYRLSSGGGGKIPSGPPSGCSSGSGFS